jgi:hypothetical protein
LGSLILQRDPLRRRDAHSPSRVAERIANNNHNDIDPAVEARRLTAVSRDGGPTDSMSRATGASSATSPDRFTVGAYAMLATA